MKRLSLLATLSLSLLSAHAQIFLGPTNSGPDSHGATWYHGASGGAITTLDFDDPATRGSYDLVLSNTVPGKGNTADWRSPVFPLGPAADHAKPVTFSFAYKLPDTVAAGNNIHVQLRFFDATGTQFINERVIPVGAQTGDSGMTAYKTITIPGIIVPRKAQTADVWIDANIFEAWNSGNAQFANISVTTVSRSLLFKAGILGVSLLGICLLTILLIYLIRVLARCTRTP